MAGVGDNFFYIKIFSPFEIFYEGEISALTAVNEAGEFDVLKNHANFITILPPGKIKILTRFGKRETVINRGVLKVSNNKVVLFSNI